MAFQFPLAMVLRVRGMVEEREERLLKGILFEIAKTCERLARNEAEIAWNYTTRDEDALKTVAAHSLHASYGEVKELNQTKDALEEQIRKLKDLRDKQLAIYASARRNREMLSDMHNDQRDIYETNAARAEQKAVDDNYMARRGRC